ncbi:MAG: hypothetical protein RLZZ142_1590 [Verrucomicrobiota bacterium]|jgi:cytochrome c553
MKTPLFLLSLPVLLVPHAEGRAADATPERDAFFESKVRPLLAEHCYECHSEQKKIKGGLALDTKQGWEKGGETGPALVPGEPGRSLLLKAVRYEDSSLEMPPKKRLSAEQIATLEQWIQMGAPDPRVAAPGTRTANPTNRIEEGRKHWAFQPPVKKPLPTVRNAQWPKNAVDRFILAALEARELKPVAPAGKRELIRRATFDLTGLPPTPQEIEAFLADESPQAFERVVDRLLASPHYGERWARHWLDVARYAEDQAHTFGVNPNTSAFRYRDWVIGAFNRDMPYDEFVKRQIAGDQLGESPEQTREQIASLGFFGLGAVYYKNSDAAKAAADELDDRVDTLTRGFLGLTVSCARCHDHKFDPIPTQDYYSLAGIFRSCQLTNSPLAPEDEVRKFDAAQAAIKNLEKQLKEVAVKARMESLESELERVPNYVQAAWQQSQKPKTGKPAALGELAAQTGLREAQLKRWTDFLSGKKPADFSSMRPWSHLLEKPVKQMEGSLAGGSEMPEEVVAVSAAIRENLRTALLEWKEALTKNPKGDGLKGAAKELDTLVGEKGPLAMGQDELAQVHSGFAEVKRACDEAKKNAPPMYPVAHTIMERKAEDMPVFIRGNPAKPGDLAPRRFLRILSRDMDPPRFTKGSGRIELAEAIANPENPLTARVMVNRIWKHHFGKGLVGTPSNFGLLGEAPTHPELLDYLAIRFVETGWSIKNLHKELMLSATYQLSSASDAHNERVDADNQWRWRMQRTRLDVESWRDALLAVSGQLDASLGGPSFPLSDASSRRRTVYAKVSRHDLASLLRLFDFPDANITSDKRTETTVPQQQLFVLNSPFMSEQARHFTKRLHADPDLADDAARIQRAYTLAFGRPASAEEQDWIRAYLREADPKDAQPLNKLTRWERVSHTLLSSNEFLYVD